MISEKNIRTLNTNHYLIYKNNIIVVIKNITFKGYIFLKIGENVLPILKSLIPD